MVTSGESEGGRSKTGVWDKEIQTTMYIINKQKGYSTGKHSHCFVIALNGVQSIKILNHYVVYLKLI